MRMEIKIRTGSEDLNDRPRPRGVLHLLHRYRPLIHHELIRQLGDPRLARYVIASERQDRVARHTREDNVV